MKIRIMGLPAEVTPAVKAIQQSEALGIIQAGGSYPNRGEPRLVRVCIEAQLRSDSGAVP